MADDTSQPLEQIAQSCNVMREALEYISGRLSENQPEETHSLISQNLGAFTAQLQAVEKQFCDLRPLVVTKQQSQAARISQLETAIQQNAEELESTKTLFEGKISRKDSCIDSLHQQMEVMQIQARDEVEKLKTEHQHNALSSDQAHKAEINQLRAEADRKDSEIRLMTETRSLIQDQHRQILAEAEEKQQQNLSEMRTEHQLEITKLQNELREQARKYNEEMAALQAKAISSETKHAEDLRATQKNCEERIKLDRDETFDLQRDALMQLIQESEAKLADQKQSYERQIDQQVQLAQKHSNVASDLKTEVNALAERVTTLSEDREALTVSDLQNNQQIHASEKLARDTRTRMQILELDKQIILDDLNALRGQYTDLEDRLKLKERLFETTLALNEIETQDKIQANEHECAAKVAAVKADQVRRITAGMGFYRTVLVGLQIRDRNKQHQYVQNLKADHVTKIHAQAKEHAADRRSLIEEYDQKLREYEIIAEELLVEKDVVHREAMRCERELFDIFKSESDARDASTREEAALVLEEALTEQLEILREEYSKSSKAQKAKMQRDFDSALGRIERLVEILHRLVSGYAQPRTSTDDVIETFSNIEDLAKAPTPQISTSVAMGLIDHGQQAPDIQSGSLSAGHLNDDKTADIRSGGVEISPNTGERSDTSNPQAPAPVILTSTDDGQQTSQLASEQPVAEPTSSGEPAVQPTAAQKAQIIWSKFLPDWDISPDEEAKVVQQLENIFSKGRTVDSVVKVIDKHVVGPFNKMPPFPRPCLFAQLAQGPAGIGGSTMTQDNCAYCKKGSKTCLWAMHCPGVSSGYPARVGDKISANPPWDSSAQPHTVSIGGKEIRWILKKRKAAPDDEDDPQIVMRRFNLVP